MKSYLTLLLLLFLPFNCFTQNYSWGDINFDGKVNVSDLTNLVDLINTATETETPQPQTPSTEKKKSLKLLILGNSFTVDACSCIAPLMSELLSDYEVTIGYMYASNSSISDHANYYDQNTQKPYYKYTSGKLVKAKAITLKEMVQDDDWDWIALQQISSQSYKTASYYPSVSNLIQRLYSVAKKPVRFAVHHAEDRKESDGGVSRFKGQAAALDDVLANTLIESIIPSGTATQNIRTLAKLNEYGDQTYQTIDGAHLQSGIGQFVESLTIIQWVINQLDAPTSVMASKIVPSEKSYYNHPRGTVCGITENNTIICRMAAMMAMKHPNQITDLNSFTTYITPE